MHPASQSISVVVPVHNHPDLVRRCLTSVPAGIEVVVVDDFSTDDVGAMVRREFPQARMLRNEMNLGFAATSNRGLRATSGSIRVVLNSDARLREGALEALSKAFSDPRVGVAGPRLYFPDGRHQTSAARFPTPGRIAMGTFGVHDWVRRRWPRRRLPLEFGMAEPDHARSSEVDWVVGTCLAIRQECFEEVDGFDEGFFMYGEETDLCWRARQRGWTVQYRADAEVEHEGGGSLAEASEHPRRILEGEVRFLQRAYGSPVLWRWRTARVVGGLVKIVVSLPAAPVSPAARRRIRWQLRAVAHAVTTPRRTLLALGGAGVRAASSRADGRGSLGG